MASGADAIAAPPPPRRHSSWLFPLPLLRSVACSALLAAAPAASGAELHGSIVGISDGDTITVLAPLETVKVRINGIDAPEKHQAFGERSKQNLYAMAYQKDAHLECHKTDRYGRRICKVWVQPSDCPACGQTLDIGLAQVIAGLAWWYREYAREQTAEDQGRYESSEREARLRKLGLWKEQHPVPPWEWRRQDKEKRKHGVRVSEAATATSAKPSLNR